MSSQDEDRSATRYRRIAQAGVGSTSIVYRGEDVVLNRPVALKCARKGFLAEKPQYRAVFDREARHLAALSHPNIVPLYEYSESADGPVLVMRYVERSLDRLSGSELGSRVGLAVRIATELAAALDYCADAGVAHRDVKLDNVLMDATGHVYLTDFGIAAAFEDAESWKHPVGPKAYLSPELLLKVHKGSNADRWRHVDQFSLGVLLYEFLTGALPHDSPVTVDEQLASEWTTCTAMQLMCRKPMIPCYERNSQIPSSVHKVLARMTSIESDDRYPSNVAASNDLNEALAGHGEREVRVFITYSRSDGDYVAELVGCLEQQGLKVWWDRQVDYGVNWDDEIERAMVDSHVMLIVMSSRSVGSEEMKMEWSYWLDYLKKPVIPLRIEECRPPYRLYHKQYMDARGRPKAEIAAEVAKSARKVVPDTPTPSVRCDRDTDPVHTVTPMVRPLMDYVDLRAPFLMNSPDIFVHSGYIPSAYRFGPLSDELGKLVSRLVDEHD